MCSSDLLFETEAVENKVFNQSLDTWLGRITPESGVKMTISKRERFEFVDFAEYIVDQVL